MDLAYIRNEAHALGHRAGFTLLQCEMRDGDVIEVSYVELAKKPGPDDPPASGPQQAKEGAEPLTFTLDGSVAYESIVIAELRSEWEAYLATGETAPDDADDDAADADPLPAPKPRNLSKPRQPRAKKAKPEPEQPAS